MTSSQVIKTLGFHLWSEQSEVPASSFGPEIQAMAEADVSLSQVS